MARKGTRSNYRATRIFKSPLLNKIFSRLGRILPIVLPIELPIVLPIVLLIELPIVLPIVLPIALPIVLPIALPIVLPIELPIVLPIAPGGITSAQEPKARVLGRAGLV